MKTLAQQLNVTDFPLIIRDKFDNIIYLEEETGEWTKYIYQDNTFIKRIQSRKNAKNKSFEREVISKDLLTSIKEEVQEKEFLKLKLELTRQIRDEIELELFDWKTPSENWTKHKKGTYTELTHNTWFSTKYGKFDYTVHQLLLIDPQYILWCYRNLDYINWSPKAQKQIKITLQQLEVI